MTPQRTIDAKLGKYKDLVTVLSPEDAIPEVDFTVLEGTICYQDEEDCRKVLTEIKNKSKEIIGIGTCTAGDGKRTGGLITQLCFKALDHFCDFFTYRHRTASEFIELDYALPVCTPDKEGVSKVIEAYLSKDDDYLIPIKVRDVLPGSEMLPDILDRDFCMGCGTCDSICPVDAITMHYARPKIDDKKCLLCGSCFQHCPRSYISLDLFEKDAFGSVSGDELIGTFIEAYSAQTTRDSDHKFAQDGGIVSAIFKYLLDHDLVDGIVAAGLNPDKPWLPQAILIQKTDEVVQTSGTKYSVCNILSAIDYSEIGDRLAMVGTPCQMQGLAKSNLYPFQKGKLDNIKYKIGILCMENFLYPQIEAIIKGLCGVDLEDALKLDIGKGNFWVYKEAISEADSAVLTTPLESTAPYEQHSCHICLDYTSELADISVGSVGSPDGWSTVIVRNEQGMELYNKVLEAGYIKSKSIGDVKPGMFLVKKLAKMKKDKNRKTIDKKIEHGKKIPYYA
jgi:coenzyme F420 hydrogenase subunit beta